MDDADNNDDHTALIDESNKILVHGAVDALDKWRARVCSDQELLNEIGWSVLDACLRRRLRDDDTAVQQSMVLIINDICSVCSPREIILTLLAYFGDYTNATTGADADDACVLHLLECIAMAVTRCGLKRRHHVLAQVVPVIQLYWYNARHRFNSEPSRYTPIYECVRACFDTLTNDLSRVGDWSQQDRLSEQQQHIITGVMQLLRSYDMAKFVSGGGGDDDDDDDDDTVTMMASVSAMMKALRVDTAHAVWHMDSKTSQGQGTIAWLLSLDDYKCDTSVQMEFIATCVASVDDDDDDSLYYGQNLLWSLLTRGVICDRSIDDAGAEVCLKRLVTIMVSFPVAARRTQTHKTLQLLLHACTLGNAYNVVVSLLQWCPYPPATSLLVYELKNIIAECDEPHKHIDSALSIIVSLLHSASPQRFQGQLSVYTPVVHDILQNIDIYSAAVNFYRFIVIRYRFTDAKRQQFEHDHMKPLRQSMRLLENMLTNELPEDDDTRVQLQCKLILMQSIIDRVLDYTHD